MFELMCALMMGKVDLIDNRLSYQLVDGLELDGE